ncbi:MAG: hypothetical protein KME30_28555 [Iphinoe sp. HA4291-MV1]|jgi:hypothetical protein|nr:hypothetical protein [Iphinoe sp. HA4291-MV1]
MVKKIYTLSILAIALIVLPSTAFAESVTRQEIDQSGTAENGGRVQQSARQGSTQKRERQGSFHCRSDNGSQLSDQYIRQNGYAADRRSRVDQQAEQQSTQRQLEVSRRNNC